MLHTYDRLKVFSFLASLVVVFGLSATARADSFTVVGNSNSTATATLNIISLTNGTLVFSVTNTSSSKVTGIGFDFIAGDFSGNQSTGINVFSRTDANGGFLTFSDGELGNVPQFNSAVLDFGFTTGNSGNFSGGNPPTGIGNGQSTPQFTVNGNFTGFSQQQIANAIYIRFQEITTCPPTGTCEDSDVGHGGTQVIPEPASMLLLGTGLLGVAAGLRRRRRGAAK